MYLQQQMIYNYFGYYIKKLNILIFSQINNLLNTIFTFHQFTEIKKKL